MADSQIVQKVFRGGHSDAATAKLSIEATSRNHHNDSIDAAASSTATEQTSKAEFHSLNAQQAVRPIAEQAVLQAVPIMALSARRR
jgi:hypothetical protein